MLLPPPPAQESGVGKTCLVNRFVSDVFSEHESLTVGYVLRIVMLPFTT